jgi:hypothetical protein
VADTGARTAVFEGTLSGAFRPGWSAVAMLAKLQFRSDAIVGATAGDAGAAGTTALTIGSTGDGNGKTQRLIGSLSANWSPQGRDRDGRTQRSEVGVFAAVRYNLDQVAGTGFASTDLASTSLLGGLDLRIGLGAHFDLGLVATVRHSPGDGTTSFALGPQLGISPVRDVLLTIGYNIKGFRDRDFAAMRSTQRGVFASVRMKFDNDSFRFLGLGK